MSADSFATVIDTLASLPTTIKAIRRARGASLRQLTDPHDYDGDLFGGGA